jgi:putative ABC transport system ATP-binding protein
LPTTEPPVEPPTAEPIVRFEDVHLDMASDAGTVNILRGITLDIAAGEITAVVGPSGAGKSSLMMVAGGLERATSGLVEVAGRDLGRLGDDDRARLRRDHIGIVFQGFHLIPTMTALENVALPLEFAGHGDAFGLARAALERVGLGHRIGHYPAQLSGGEQQRVAVARAFVGQPKLMLADEPTGNLDGATGKQVMDLLFELARSHGTTLVLITHDMGLAERCDRVLRIADGLLVADQRLRPAALAAQ